MTKDGQTISQTILLLFNYLFAFGIVKKSSRRSVFWINGYERPRLVLARGKKYQLNIVAQGQPFYFTTSHVGGTPRERITELWPSDYTVATVVVDNILPDTFYYQSVSCPDTK